MSMTAVCPHGQQAKSPTAKAVSLALDAAHNRVVSAGQRMTIPRRRVLELLVGSGSPVKAYDLVSAYYGAGRVAKPATIYRALEFLRRLGLAHRLSSSNTYVACTLGMAAHPAAFLICNCCGSCREISAPGAAVIVGIGAGLGYSIDHVTIEGEGRCLVCCDAVRPSLEGT